MEKKLTIIDWVAFILVIIGGLNWGLVGVMQYDLVYTLFGDGIISMIIYILVGLSALFMLISIGKYSRK